MSAPEKPLHIDTDQAVGREGGVQHWSLGVRGRSPGFDLPHAAHQERHRGLERDLGDHRGLSIRMPGM